MGFLDGLFKKKPTKVDPDELRTQLFDAAARADKAELIRLCRAHEATIEVAISAWRKIPEDFQSDREKLEWYGRGLIAVAQTFAEQLKNEAIMAALSGDTDGHNPIAEWQANVEAIDEIVEAGDLALAEERLTAALPGIESLAGSDAAKMRAMTLGRIGHCRFHAMRAEESIECFEQAEALSTEAGDTDGVITAIANRMEVLRWLGRHDEAAPLALRLAELHREMKDVVTADRFESRAKVMSAGEPLLRVLLEIDGRTLELGELPEQVPEGSARAILERNRITLNPCIDLVTKGTDLAVRGEYAESLEYFEQAAKADPYDPHCHYERGFTLMLLGRTVEAVEAYERAEELAPGWYNSRADLWLARQVTAGVVRIEHAQAALLVEGVQDAKARFAMAEMLSENASALPFGWLYLAQCEETVEARAEAIEEGLECQGPDDLRARLLFLKAAPDPVTHRDALEEIIRLDAHLVSSALATLVLRTTPGL